MEHIEREEFWGYITTLLHSETERVVVFDSFVMGMKPVDIFNNRRDLFESINDVYRVKRDVLGRLSHDMQLRRILTC
jgi:hypothetical protein